jgi:hypothetical protein
MVAFELDELLGRAGAAARSLATLYFGAGILAGLVFAQAGLQQLHWHEPAFVLGSCFGPAALCFVSANRLEARRDWAGVALIVMGWFVIASSAAGIVLGLLTGGPALCCPGPVVLVFLASGILLVRRGRRALVALREFQSDRRPIGFQPILSPTRFGGSGPEVGPEPDRRRVGPVGEHGR